MRGLQWVLSRLKEPSSWAAVSALLALSGVHVSDEVWQYVTTLGSGLAGLAGVLLNERTTPASSPAKSLLENSADLGAVVDRLHSGAAAMPTGPRVAPSISPADGPRGQGDGGNGWNG